MGRSRGGLTAKIHAPVDANGLPIALKLTTGQAHDRHSAADMLDTLGDGDVLLADRLMTAARFVWRWRHAARGPASSRCPTESDDPPSAPSSIATATSSNVHQKAQALPRQPLATTSTTITSSPQSSSPPSASGSGVMRRWPSLAG